MFFFWVAEYIFEKEFLLSYGQCRFLLSFKAVRELQFLEHIISRILSKHSVIDCHLKDLMKHIVNIINRGDFQRLYIYERVVELSYIRLFHLNKTVLSEVRFYKHLIHIDIILECAVLDPSFELTPKVEHLVYGDGFYISPYSVVSVYDNLFFLLSQLFKGRGVN